MSKLEEMQKKVKIAKAEAAIMELEMKVMGDEENIIRKKEHIELQKLTIQELKGE